MPRNASYEFVSIRFVRQGNAATFQGMNDPEGFEDMRRRLGSMSQAEKMEILITYFGGVVQEMDRETLVAFRDSCFAQTVGTPEETTLLEIIEGRLALIDLQEE